MIKKLSDAAIVMFLLMSFMPVLAEDIHIEFFMPGSMFGPGSPFSVDLGVENTGNAYADAQLFVALTVGTGDFWFYPSWVKFPPDIDWENVFVFASSSDQWVILPEFSWPHGAGSFEGAMFLSAIVHNGELVSNLAEHTFGWSETPQPTPTSHPPTSTPTSTIPTSSPTPSGPTPTPPPAPTGFVYIPPGTYMRGSPSDEACRETWGTDELQHQVTLTRGFYMMTTEVTRQMWVDLQVVQPMLPDDPSRTEYGPTMAHPVQWMTWFEVVLFANLLSLQDGLTQAFYKDEAFSIPVDATNYTTGPFYCDFDANGYRMLTEAEWEYTCRAGTTGPFSAHEPNYSEDTCNTCSPSPPLNALDLFAWWCGNSYTGSGPMAHPVGTKLPNPWGLYDMHGNVWEWCWDWSGTYPSWPVTDPTGPSAGSDRVERGGSWATVVLGCRSAYRVSSSPGIRNVNTGFRLVRTVH